MKIPKQIKEWLPVALVVAILGAIGWFGTQIVHSIADQFWKYIAPVIPQTLLLSLCSFLLLVIVLLVIWVIWLHRAHRDLTPAQLWEKFHDRFGEFDSGLGLWRHKSKSGYFCPSCKVRGIESQMRETPQHIQCMVKECRCWVQKPQPELPLVKNVESELTTKGAVTAKLIPGVQLVPPPK